MKRISLILAVISMVVLLVSPASAGGIQQGTVEVNTQTYFNRASYSFDGNGIGSFTTLNLSGNVGYFVTSLVEIIGGVGVVHQGFDPDGGESQSTTDFGAGASVRLNFATSGSAVPFIGIGAGVVAHSGDVLDDQTTIAIPSVEVGMRFIVGSSASVNVGFAYEYQINALGIDEVSGNVFLLGVGISAFVSGGPE